MASPVWTLTCTDTGQSMTLDNWGDDQAQRTLQPMKPAELQISFSKSGFTQSPPFALGQACILYRDGTPWFQGQLYAARRVASGSSERQILTFRDVWQQLEAITYLQKASAVTSDAVGLVVGSQEVLTDAQVTFNIGTRQNLNSYTTATLKTPLVFSGTDDTTGSGVTSGVSITQALNYALSVKPGIFTIGTTIAGILTPREQMRDVSIAEFIRRLMRWTPDVIVWVDQSTTPPTINVGERGSIAARTFTVGTDAITQGEITPRFDLYRAGVKIYLIRPFNVGTLSYQAVTVDSAGDLTDPTKILVASLELDPITIDPATGERSAYDPDPTGVAARLFQAIGAMFYQGTVGLALQDLTADNWISQVVNIAGADPELASMRAMVQQSVENIERGRVTITLGPPPQLTAADIQALQRIGRRRIPATQGQVQTNTNGGGSTPTTNIQPPSNGGNLNGPLTPTNDMPVDTSPGTGLLSDFQKSTAGNNAVFHLPAIYPAFGPVPAPLVPIGSGTALESALQQITNAGIGWTNQGYVISASLDLTAYPTTAYKRARIVFTVQSNIGLPGSFTYYIEVSAGIGKKGRISIPLANVPMGIFPSDGVVGGNNQKQEYNVITATNVQLQLGPL